MIDKKINQNSEIFFEYNGKWESLKVEDFKLKQESEPEWGTFSPVTRKQSEELIIPFNAKPFKIYFRTKNRRIKKKQIKKSPFLRMYLYVKNMSGLSSIVRGVDNDK